MLEVKSFVSKFCHFYLAFVKCKIDKTSSLMIPIHKNINIYYKSKNIIKYSEI